MALQNPFSIEVVNLTQRKQSSCRIMICQLEFKDYDWSSSSGLFFPIYNEKIDIKINELLKIARHNSVDLVIFPELSIPEKFIEKLQEWSREQRIIIIGGSHYHKTTLGFISRSPVIINGKIFFTEKLTPSPLELSPILGEGLIGGHRIIKFTNTAIGNFAVTICSDYLSEEIKSKLDLESLDILCVPSFQKDSDLYYRRMNTDCENSREGLYILYSNFYEEKYGDGHSAVFGIMDNLYTQKLKSANHTDLNPDKKIFQFNRETSYMIADISLETKRPFINRNISTSPNFYLISTNSTFKNSELSFIQKVAHDDERYKRIDELFVAPLEYEEILKTLDQKKIVFIIGDPGIGKTYTAAKILKEHFEQGYTPIWFPGLEKEDRESQNKILTDFIPSDNQIIYFEDPFGRTIFERRDSIFQVFSPLLDKLSSLNSKIIVSSRKEIFEQFSKESLLEKELLQLRIELNIRNPSYDSSGLISIFDKLASIACDWYDKVDFRESVYQAVMSGRLSTPLAIRDLIFVSRNLKSKKDLEEHINRRNTGLVKTFALEILSAPFSTKLVLFLVYFSGFKGKSFLSQLFDDVTDALAKSRYTDIIGLSFNLEIRSQVGYRIEQFGYLKSSYKFSHPIYEEALSTLLISDTDCEIIARAIFYELIRIETKIAYAVVNKIVIKYPDVALYLFNYMREINISSNDDTLNVLLSQKLISTYTNTRNSAYFDLAFHFYPLGELVKNINSQFVGWYDVVQKITLCQRYLNNSPDDFDTSAIQNINWAFIFSNKGDSFINPKKLLNFLIICHAINQKSILIFWKIKGNTFVKRLYILLLIASDRNRLYDLLEGHPIQKELKSYGQILEESVGIKSKNKLMRKVIFSDYQYHGKITVDIGAAIAILNLRANLLPIGILNVIGEFSEGSIIAIFDERNALIGVGVSEFSSNDLKKIKGHNTSELHGILENNHSYLAIRKEFLHRLYPKQFKKWVLIK
ncbi:nSTAND3 domain-containing NTPase [Chitinophaga filiformis]|uniref:PUA domain-containing protein n=1 Tax=Chitinophaga filiformis TaxID=104663 RepID=A0A1G7SLW3_CHIFI|nr:PUA domain-containing protein [Chitinophaga filiformis]SDG23902.1 PUA domain-containing protein [Chitinophaga filiformis]